MTQRYFVYPLAVLAIAQLWPLLRGDRRWFAAQIAQLILILLAVTGGLIFEDDIIWVWLAWIFFVAFVILPRWLARVAGESHRPALWRWAGRFAWGQLGRLYRRYARVEELWAQAHRPKALALLEVEPVPETVRGDRQLLRLQLLADACDWTGLLSTYENFENWGTAATVTRIRLLAARAYAKAGNFERAIRCLQLAAQSPRTLGHLAYQYRAAREEVTGLLPETLRDLARESLLAAEGQAAEWRALMSWGQPAPVTLALLLLCVVTGFVDRIFWDGKLWEWAGNIPELLHEGEWWRPVTALFLHANIWHLAVNGVTLWMFGSAVERTMGPWRMVAVFLLSGAAANAMSGWVGHYDVSVGASGGIFGLVAAFGVCVYRLRSPFYAAARKRLLGLLAVMLTTDLTVGGLEPQIDNLAHAGGFVVGLLLALALARRRRIIANASNPALASAKAEGSGTTTN